MTQHARPKPRLSRGLFYLIVIGLILLGIAGFVFSQRGSESAVNIASGEPRPMPVTSAKVQYSDNLIIHENYTGLVSARRSSALGFETGGVVKSIFVDIGDQVKTGDKLSELDVRTLNANLLAAKANKAEAQAALKIAKTTVERQAALEEKGLLSPQRYDEASAQTEAAIARLSAAEAQIDALNVRLALSRLDAPFDGVISRRFLDEGSIAAPGQAIVQIVESGVLEATIGVPSDLARNLKSGDSYTLKIDGKTHSATLRPLSGVIEASQRTVPAVFELGPENTSVYPGAVARLELEQKLSETGFWLPVSAMTEADRGLWSVYAVIKNDDGAQIIEKRLVDLVHAEANRAFVRGALEDGDVYVSEGLHRLTAGMKVAPVKSKSLEPWAH